MCHRLKLLDNKCKYTSNTCPHLPHSPCSWPTTGRQLLMTTKRTTCWCSHSTTTWSTTSTWFSAWKLACMLHDSPTTSEQMRVPSTISIKSVSILYIHMNSSAHSFCHIYLSEPLQTRTPHQWPFHPDLATPRFATEAKMNSGPEELKVALIGFCTNSRSRASSPSHPVPSRFVLLLNTTGRLAHLRTLVGSSSWTLVDCVSDSGTGRMLRMVRPTPVHSCVSICPLGLSN